MSTVITQTNSIYVNQNWTPASDSDCVLWLSAQGTSYTNGQAVTTLTDMSPAGLTISAGGTGGGPTFTTSVINGYPGIKFNGTNHYMKAASMNSYVNVAIIVAGALVGSSSGNQDGLFLEHSANANNGGFYLAGTTGQTFLITGTGGSPFSYIDATASWWSTTAIKGICYYTNATPAYVLNSAEGVQFATSVSLTNNQLNTVPARTITDNFWIMSRDGSSLFNPGYIFEVAIFSSASTAKTANWAKQASNFIWNKWSI
jgi:hypothetical protein